MVIINDFNRTNVKVDKRSDKNILIYYTGYEASDGVKPLYIDFNEINGYFENDHLSKYVTLIAVDSFIDIIKFVIKLNILLSQKIVSQVIMMINTSTPNLIWVIFCH